MTLNMSSLEEVTNQLMKSVKELADWEYPLSEILAKYYTLLDNPIEVNYGEAALVVQNSTDVYTKRVDYLGKEVSNLSESFLQHEAEEEKSKSKSKEKRTRKTIIDFDNFELLDFKKDIGKNINLKPSSQKPVKLLNRRFPQLETATTQLLTPIEVFDVHGEIIGKKYDFRCNQQLTINGMLVDECIPNDFDEPNLCTSNPVHSTLIHQTEESILISPNSTTVENNTTQEDTGYFSLTENTRIEETTVETNKTFDPIEELSETVQENIDSFQQTAQSSLGMDYTEELNDEPTQFDDDVIDHDDYIEIEELENQETFENTTNSIELLNNPKETNAPESQIETVQDNNNQSNQVEYQLENQEISDDMRNSLEVVHSSKECNDSQNQIDTIVNGNSQLKATECQPNIISETSTDKSAENNQDQEEDESGVGNCKETDSGYRSGESEDYEIPRRRSKRMKNMVCVVNDMNKNVWKPIPFDQGIPEKLPKSRSKFKLPCHISLLKSKCTSRKRKHPSEEVKRRESLSKFVMNETESPLKKLNMYSPSRPFMPLKAEELNDFQKSFEDCIKSRQCYDVFHYEAATTITMDLLGFFPSFTKKDPLSNSTLFKTLVQTPEHVSASCSDPGFSPRPISPEIVIFDTNSPPDSPIMTETFDAEEPLHPTLNYQQLIESRMKEIYEEFDVRTDLEQNVARWHQMIQPKLQEEERRPPFHIYEYSDRIVEKLEETTERRIAFDSLIVDQSPAEAARYFSAALQLANTYNVDIQTSEKKTDIELILLNSAVTRHEITCETPKSSRPKNTKKFKPIT